jgi:hypothetical protein
MHQRYGMLAIIATLIFLALIGVSTYTYTGIAEIKPKGESTLSGLDVGPSTDGLAVSISRVGSSAESSVALNVKLYNERFETVEFDHAKCKAAFVKDGLPVRSKDIDSFFMPGRFPVSLPERINGMPPTSVSIFFNAFDGISELGLSTVTIRLELNLTERDGESCRLYSNPLEVVFAGRKND